MKKSVFLVGIMLYSIHAFSQSHSAYVKGLVSFGLQEYTLPVAVGGIDAYRPAQALAAEVGFNFRVKQFEITPLFGYGFNTEGFWSNTDSGEFSGSYRLHRGYLGLGAFYAVNPGFLNIKELLVGGGLLTALPSQLRIQENGNTIYTASFGSSWGAFAEVKTRFETRLGIWIEPSLRMVFQDFKSKTSAGSPIRKGNALQPGLAVVFPFKDKTDQP